MDNSIALTAFLTAARSVHIGACLLLFGVLAFDRFIAPPALALGQDVRRYWGRVLVALMGIAIPAALVSGVGWLALNAIAMSGLPAREALTADVLGVVWRQTHFGRLWQLRGWILLATCLILIGWMISRRRFPRVAWGLSWLALLLCAGLAASLAWAGHGLMDGSDSLHIWADVVHLLIAGLWPIGLAPLALLLIKLRRGQDAARWTAIHRVVRRFSAMSIASVLLLTLSGVVNAWALVGSISDVFSTAYGRVLIVKVSVFAMMVAIGAVNWLRLSPRLRARDGDNAPPCGPNTVRQLQRNVLIELVLAVVVFVLVGILGLLPPAMGMMMGHHAETRNSKSE